MVTLNVRFVHRALSQPALRSASYRSPSLHVRSQHAATMNGLKRSKFPSSSTTTSPPPKRTKTNHVVAPDASPVPRVPQANADAHWPAPEANIARARRIISEAAQSNSTILIVPDKDADGLSAGVILRNTLLLLGLAKERIHVHLLSKGNTVHSDHERAKMAAFSPAYIFVVDQGSRSGPPLIDSPHTGLIIDHHHATPEDFPRRSEHVTACNSEPVATSSLLTYEICRTLHPEIETRCDWLCIVGTHGDLGTSLKWEPPFPDMKHAFKEHTKKTLNDVVSLVNAPRRTSTYDVESAWAALSENSNPKEILRNARLLAARFEINAEVERCTHAAPKFSQDGRVAVLRIHSQAQVHPVIATRWAGHLQSKALEIVMVANDGYLTGKVNFSCRIARCARSKEPPVDIIHTLKAYASLPPLSSSDSREPAQAPQAPLIDRLGDDFARGHVQASGGIVSAEHFEEFMKLMRVGDKPKKDSASSNARSNDSPQKNKIHNYFGTKAGVKKA